MSGVGVLALAVGATVLVGSTAADAAVIYTETFDNTSGSNQLLTYDGNGAAPGGGTWRNYYGNTQKGPGGVGITSPLFGLVSGDSSTGATTNGRLTVDGFNYPDNPFVFDSLPTFLESGAYLSVGNLTTADFWLRMNTIRNAKFALQIGSQWYVTETNYSSTVTDVWKNHVVDIQAANWRTLVVNPGVSVVVGGTAQTLSAHGASGSLSSVGLYAGDLNGTFWRVDTITVNSVVIPVPEPASLSLALLGFGLMMIRRRAH